MAAVIRLMARQSSRVLHIQKIDRILIWVLLRAALIRPTVSEAEKEWVRQRMRRMQVVLAWFQRVLQQLSNHACR